MAFPIAAILGIASTILDRVIPDKAAAEKAKAEIEAALVKSVLDGNLAQIEVNKAEAAHSSVFVSGWRPAIGWICAAAMAYSYLVVPFFQFILTVNGKPVPKLPVLDNALWELVFGMLGMGALRSYEKFKGVAK